MGSASFGLQIGLEQSEVVLFIMSQKALDAVMRNEFKFGANAGLAVVTLGSSVGAATTSAVGADIVVWASSSGAYAGITLDGSIIKPSPDADRDYYGRGMTTREILYDGQPCPAPAGCAPHSASDQPRDRRPACAGQPVQFGGGGPEDVRGRARGGPDRVERRARSSSSSSNGGARCPTGATPPMAKSGGRAHPVGVGAGERRAEERRRLSPDRPDWRRR